VERARGDGSSGDEVAPVALPRAPRHGVDQRRRRGGLGAGRGALPTHHRQGVDGRRGPLRRPDAPRHGVDQRRRGGHHGLGAARGALWTRERDAVGGGGGTRRRRGAAVGRARGDGSLRDGAGLRRAEREGPRGGTAAGSGRGGTAAVRSAQPLALWCSGVVVVGHGGGRAGVGWGAGRAARFWRL
jgi:hypothetical protein